MLKSDKKYKITIKNWHKYQRGIKGKRRFWIAISVDLFSDPDYLAMTSLYRNLWLALLLHAGKVGPVFELSPSYARVMFKLARSCDFRVLRNQGFIELQNPTKQTKQNKTEQRKKPPQNLPAVSEVVGLNLDAWDAWITYRCKTKKKAYTTNMKATELARLPHDDQLKCVEYSIGNEYAGLFPDRVHDETRKRTNEFEDIHTKNRKAAGLD